MKLPFSQSEFFAVFAAYNSAVWPVQLLLVGFGVLVVGVALRPRPWSSRLASWILALLWMWMGLVYQFGFFRAINPAAGFFAAGFVLEGALLGVAGGVQGRLDFHFQPTPQGFGGALLIGYALVGYPLLASLLGQQFPATPTFGLPCPTTIFTLGVLLWLRRPAPVSLLVIPLAWTVIGTAAALQLGVSEDFGLVVAGVATVVLRFVPWSGLSALERGRPLLEK
jgi:Family of unknown function (DUF6064)